LAFFKGASSNWWKTRHNRHHAKTNIEKNDPDVHTEPLFYWTRESAKREGNKDRVKYQHLYWWFFGPPVVTTLLFVYQNYQYMKKYAKTTDAFWTLLFFTRFFTVYSYFLGFWGAFALYFSMRFIESHWFSWVTSMSHLPREIKYEDDLKYNWFVLQLRATQNISSGSFHDWFTGHLNYQIEHHLFPMMPRHNYHIIAPQVKQLCEKHNIEYLSKSMTRCCQDILDKLVFVAGSVEKQD